MSATITLAKQISTGKILHINEVDKSIPKIFHCQGCNNKLIVVKSIPRKKDWHFRHPPDSNIAKCRSTALHDYAAQILMDNSAITLSKALIINYSLPKKEVWLNTDYRSDVTASYETSEVHFEVFVTHDLGQDKIDFYKKNSIKCVRINLSNKELLVAPPENIKEMVLTNFQNKTLFGWEEESNEIIIEQKKNPFNPWPWILLIGAFLIYLFSSNKKQTRKKGR